MKTITIQAEQRSDTGKGAAREARRQGRLPGILYGQGKSIALSVNRREFANALTDAQTHNVIFDLTLPGQPPLKSIAREIQHDPISRRMLHVDFQHIDMSRKLHVSVALHLVGESEGVKNHGGILEHVAREVEVSCLPAEIPEFIEVDVSHLGIGDSIHVSDLKAGGYEFLDEPFKVVVLVAAPTVEKVEVEAAPEEVVAEEGEAPAAPAADAPKE